MTLASIITNAQNQLMKPFIEASTGTWDGPNIVDPVILPGLYKVTADGGMDNINATATLYFVINPTIAINAPIQVFAGYNGEGEAMFKGEVAAAPWKLEGGGWALVCRDRLARTRGGWPGPPLEYSELDDEAIIRNIIESYGLPAEIQDIDSDGWLLGIVDDVVLAAGDDGASLISAIDEMTEMRTFTDLLGRIRRAGILAGLAAGSVWTLEYGVNIISIDYDPDPQWPNIARVTGLTYEDLEIAGEATAVNPDIPTPPGDLADEKQSNLVETNDRAALSAQYRLNVKRMYAKRFGIVTIFNPLIQPADMVSLDVPPRDLLGDTIVEGVSHSVGGGAPTTTLRCIGLLNAGAESTGGFPPLASFDCIIDRETVIIDDVPTPLYFVAATDTSTDSDGFIVSQLWAADGGTPNSGTAPDFLTALAGLDADIVLTVTDNHGQTDSATTTLDAPGAPAIQTRPLLIAAGSAGLLYFDQGQIPPRSYAMPDDQECTAVPIFFENSAPHAGGAAGAIVRIDDVDDPLTLVDTLAGGAVGCVFINAANPLHILAGAGPVLYRATDGETFEELATFDDDITDIQSSPTDLNEIRACAGPSLWQSFDAEVFTAIVTGAEGTTAQQMATAGWGNAVCFTGGADPADAIRFETADPALSVDWSGVIGPPDEIRSITPLLTTQGYMAGGTDGRIYQLLKSGATFVASHVATITGGGAILDLDRDGAINRLLFLTGPDGTRKLVNSDPAVAYLLDATAGLQIGYGPLVAYVAALVSVPGVYWPTWGATEPGIWHHDEAVWVLIPFPLDDVPYYFYGIAANRLGTALLVSVTTNTTGGGGGQMRMDVDSDDILRMPGSGHSPLWHVDLTTPTPTWTEVLLTSPWPGPFSAYQYVFSATIQLSAPHWSTAADYDWIITRTSSSGDDPEFNTWWRGTGTTVAAPESDDGPGVWAQPAWPGADGDIVSLDWIGGSQQIHYVPPAGTDSIVVGADVGANNTPILVGQIDLLAPEGRELVYLSEDNRDLWYSPDYQATTPTQQLLAAGRYLTAATDGVYVGGRLGVLKVTGLGGSVDSAVVAAEDLGVDWIRADRQAGTSIAAKLTDSFELVATVDGVTWDTIAGPEDSDGMSFVFEVIAA